MNPNYYAYPAMRAVTYGHSWMWPISILFCIGIVVLILLVVRPRHWHHHGHGMWQHSNALNILQERYAKGEITKEQFEDMKKTLEA